MKTFGKSVFIFLFFFVGTLALIHVDQQSGQMAGETVSITEIIEKFIEK